MNLKFLRESKNLSQQELAKRVGRATRTIIRWEKGEADLRQSDVEKLKQALGCSDEDLSESKAS